ncbi:hypothetical protein L486_07389 [Kwoniella mangroviensis CBS 10435]|uniref:Uncharacterized protein n=1 Tax=Kwoniella mangroviensis CBS 10435 TaxID=1331196 RepID=A0A1B9II33_9TREE|nr:hypothetical protein L486_07389 [Kwoniella mangroviensis CBS 10435]OCF71997.1 hypothetical protein I204_07261 [Kwoniella mangroviensis CBS 8886]
MPITKKKGTLFAIYADTPERPSSSTSSSSSSPSTKINNQPKSPSKKSSSSSLASNGTRKALGTLQPKALDRSTTLIGSNGKDKTKTKSESSARSKLVYTDPVGDVPIKQTKSTSDIPLKSKSTTTQNQSRTKSSINVFNDENSISTSTSTSSKRTKPLSGPSSPKTRKSAPTPLAPSQPIKRSRDLLSPLPIIAPPTSIKASSGSGNAAIARVDDPSESPAKRNRIALESTSTSTSTPVRVGRKDKEIEMEDKENIPVGMGYSPITSDSPASRTRSKIRALTLSRGSPLRAERTTTVRKVKRVERLIGDGRGTLTLKKGRELSDLVNAEGEGENGSLENAIKSIKPSPTKRSNGKGVEVEVQMLGDVSEAYGADRGVEPEGFKTQRVSTKIDGSKGGNV